MPNIIKLSEIENLLDLKVKFVRKRQTIIPVLQVKICSKIKIHDDISSSSEGGNTKECESKGG